MKSYNLDQLELLTESKAKALRAELLDKSPFCQLCGEKIDSPVLDHKHMKKTETIGKEGAGLVRGVICSGCNVLLGKIENNYKRYKVKNLSLFLKNASNYIEKDCLPYVYPSETKRLKELLPKSLYNKLIKQISIQENKPINEVKEKIKYNKFMTKKIKTLLIKFNLLKD